MEEKGFLDLLHLIDRLLGPTGCPWDREQSLVTVRKFLLEETHELIDAIDENDPHHIREELGDILFLVLFLAKLGERDGILTTKEMMEAARAKSMGRHPHVFGDEKIQDAAQVLERWEEWKKREKSQQKRKSLLDGVPKEFPALSKAQKMIKKLRKQEFSLPNPAPHTEEAFGKELFDHIQGMEEQNVDAELALLKYLRILEGKFREWEAEKASSTPFSSPK